MSFEHVTMTTHSRLTKQQKKSTNGRPLLYIVRRETHKRQKINFTPFLSIKSNRPTHHPPPTHSHTHTHTVTPINTFPLTLAVDWVLFVSLFFYASCFVSLVTVPKLFTIKGLQFWAGGSKAKGTQKKRAVLSIVCAVASEYKNVNRPVHMRLVRSL